jgi:hypothetical protein
MRSRQVSPTHGPGPAIEQSSPVRGRSPGASGARHRWDLWIVGRWPAVTVRFPGVSHVHGSRCSSACLWVVSSTWLSYVAAHQRPFWASPMCPAADRPPGNPARASGWSLERCWYANGTLGRPVTGVGVGSPMVLSRGQGDFGRPPSLRQNLFPPRLGGARVRVAGALRGSTARATMVIPG